MWRSRLAARYWLDKMILSFMSLQERKSVKEKCQVGYKYLEEQFSHEHMKLLFTLDMSHESAWFAHRAQQSRRDFYNQYAGSRIQSKVLARYGCMSSQRPFCVIEMIVTTSRHCADFRSPSPFFSFFPFLSRVTIFLFLFFLFRFLPHPCSPSLTVCLKHRGHQ